MLLKSGFGELVQPGILYLKQFSLIHFNFEKYCFSRPQTSPMAPNEVLSFFPNRKRRAALTKKERRRKEQEKKGQKTKVYVKNMTLIFNLLPAPLSRWQCRHSKAKHRIYDSWWFCGAKRAQRTGRCPGRHCLLVPFTLSFVLFALHAYAFFHILCRQL